MMPGKINELNKFLVVIDTNVIVSALLSKHKDSATVKIMEALFSSKIIPLYNEEIMDEYLTVLNREKFNFSIEVITILIKAIYDNGMSVERLISNEKFIDSNDLVFYEVCLAKQDEDSFLVTGNIKHFPKKSFIVTPSQLFDIIK